MFVFHERRPAGVAGRFISAVPANRATSIHCGEGVKCDETSVERYKGRGFVRLDRVGQGVVGGRGGGWSVRSGRYPRLLSRPVIVSS